MAGQGMAGAKLEVRFGNHLFVPVSINNQHAALMIDTGAPHSMIDRNSVGTFKLTVENTKEHVGGVFGRSWERFGVSKVKSMAMGNCTLTNVPVGIVDESDMNYYSRLPHIHGLFGLHEMAKFGMVIDCARKMLYINPNGPSAALSQKLAGFLAGRGFTRIPMRLNSTAHFDVEGSLNGHPTRFVIDTGGGLTIIDKKIAVASGIGFSPLALTESGVGGLSQQMNKADVKELRIGSFTINNAEVEVGNLSPELLSSNGGILGPEHMALNFAVIDCAAGMLYLRHPDKG